MLKSKFANSLSIIIAIIGILVLNILNHMTDAATFTQRALIHPAHPGKCYDAITKRALLPNKEYKPKGICAIMVCDIKQQSINIETCPYVDMPGCEEIVTDLAWSYPKCCAQFKCIDPKTGLDFIVSI